MGNKVKVRSLLGAYICDLYYHLQPMIERKPDSIILIIGTNDAVEKGSHEILNELLDLKNWILTKLPETKVIISCPTIRCDNQIARLTSLRLRNNLQQLDINLISNENVLEEHLAYKGLHLNNRGSSRLAWNYLSYIRKD